MGRSSGRIKFTVVKQPDPQPEIEPGMEPDAETATVTTAPITMADAANDPIELPPGSRTGSATISTSSTLGAPKRKKRREGKTLAPPEAHPPSPETAGGRELRPRGSGGKYVKPQDGPTEVPME
ncbi:hypothetical protein HBI56_092480 [Parastagonospora nodorum]|nr:hypothetical protein HBH53_139630 [Parastagonospora nodorum]KAH3989423.1 hypothetical protein HBH52_020730 [Parastagonospora nodorum]KAH3998298.1 hypothetical protein HBI10_133580 [Parastagonospora nodorum]KAH4029873.1 hypothetical protein HBI13_034020 [Parastagonospora nodorum]KAH4034113.1 hypothetical protein HBI09_106390 [Parastagonospora nodorum]